MDKNEIIKLAEQAQDDEYLLVEVESASGNTYTVLGLVYVELSSSDNNRSAKQVLLKSVDDGRLSSKRPERFSEHTLLCNGL